MRTGRVAWSDELYRIYGLEPGAREVTYDWFLSAARPDDRPRIERATRESDGTSWEVCVRGKNLSPRRKRCACWTRLGKR